jgi:hypothetical protein
MPSNPPTSTLEYVHDMSFESDFGFQMDVELPGLAERTPCIQMTVEAEKIIPTKMRVHQYKRDVLPPIYCGRAYLRREYANTRSWTGPSKAATRVSLMSAVQAKQRVQTRAAKKRVPHDIQEKQQTHCIASPARTFAPFDIVDRSSELYTITRIGCYVFVTVVVKNYREEKRINSARTRVYIIVDGMLQVKPVVDKDFTDLPANDDDLQSIDLPDDDGQIYHVTWQRICPQNNTEKYVYISCGLDAESEQNILHSITLYMASPNT